ncbi:MAG: hypothetical protein GF417_11425, partial [Candidatus Latescibacteria bacterium]|nr:hypothetical protein [bacterium]MBD3425034.1 hypothetical protein [Candidatus Latescibacterota bacterium]
MNLSTIVRISICSVFIIAAYSGCSDDTTGLEPAPFTTDPVVFDDDFGSSVDYQAFAGSDFNAISIDNATRYEGSASIRIVVPDAGSYAGGAFTTNELRNLTGYDALTFWAKASKSIELDVAGLGNDNTGTSKYTAEWHDIEMDTNWSKYIIPIPLPGKLDAEGGLFFFAEAAEGLEGHDIWVDEIKFEDLEDGVITNPRPEMTSQAYSSFVGGEIDVTGTYTTFSVNGSDQVIEHMPGYFSFISSADSIAVGDGEDIDIVGPGTASITAKLGEIDVTGTLTLNVFDAPQVPAPTPAENDSNVISIFSNSYDDITVDTWSAVWDMADVSDFKLSGDDIKAYTNLLYAGVEFTGDLIDATDMEYFHIDIWVPDGVTAFKIKLVDFGEDGAYLGAPDSERQLTFDSSSTPALITGDWFSLDIPIEDFMNGPNGLFAR